LWIADFLYTFCVPCRCHVLRDLLVIAAIAVTEDHQVTVCTVLCACPQCVQMHLLNVTRTAGQKLLFESKFTEAIPAAMQSLRVAVDLYGLASVELVPSYLILGRASIGAFVIRG